MIENDRYHRRYVTDTTSGYIPLKSGLLKRTVLDSLVELQYRVTSKIISEKNYTDETYINDEPYQPIEDRNAANFANELTRRFEHLKREYSTPNSTNQIDTIIQFIDRVEATQSVWDLVKDYLHVLKKLDHYVNFLSQGNAGYTNLITKSDRLLLVTDINELREGQLDLRYKLLNNAKFVNLASALDTKIRHENRQPTPEEYLTRQIAFEMVSIRGYNEAPIVPWGNSGFRAIQTQASITDPGLGHLTGTVKSMDYINGTNVHIEYLERGQENDRELVEPYRLPDLATIGKVKMEVGKDTSVSSYVGRPMFEDTFEHSFIKTAHTTIGVCSAIFMNGLSECKVAIERMTATQAIKFMKTVSANVVRDSHLQVLAAAFCINYPLIDDRSETLKANNGKPRKVIDRMEIAKLGIELAYAGNFEKVTFDGTANWYPSDPIMEQLGYQNALTLVHSAHEVGLLTYFSAGFRFKHLTDIVDTGTDGIGLGGAQILRFMDSSNGFQGPFKAENVGKILSINRQATASIIGQGGVLLCRLDRLYFERTISASDERHRDDLFSALLNKDEDEVSKLISECDFVAHLPVDLAHPLVCWANRLIQNENNCIAFDHISTSEKQRFISELELHVDHHDYDELAKTLSEIQQLQKR